MENKNGNMLDSLKKEVTLLELFSGIGGFSEGFIRAGYTLKNHFFSEVDNHAIANYKYNYKNAKYVGSVKNVRGIIRTIENIGSTKLIITFGSPCQDFSLAGKGLGLDGNKSSLIKYAIFLIKWLKPDVFIWENVKGAFSTNDGADYWAIIQAFANLNGYGFEQQLLNTSWFLPQNRERIYIVGHLTGRSEPGIFPFTESDELHFERNSKVTSNIASTLNANDNKSWVGNFISKENHSNWKCGFDIHAKNDEKYAAKKGGIKKLGSLNSSQDGAVFSLEGDSQILSAGHGNVPKIQIKANTANGFQEAKEGDSINLSNPNSKTRRGRVGNGVANTLDTSSNQGVVVGDFRSDEGFRERKDGNSSTLQASAREYSSGSPILKINSNIRRLTEIECERLQGFSDNWTKYGIYQKQVWINKKEKTYEIVENLREIPKTQRYKMCGNAVTVIVVHAIASKLKLLNTK